MASYQTRQRDPLLDSNTQAAIEKRGRQLLGIALVVVGLMAWMMIWSYSPDDPNFMTATDAPIQNWLGRFGASAAAPLFMIFGSASLGIGVVLMAWGFRLTFNRLPVRPFGRLVFAPFAIVVLSIYCATLDVPQGWDHSFGRGGLFGDTVLSILLTVVGASSAFAIKLFSVISGIAFLAILAYVLGFTLAELKAFARFLIVGVIVTYDYVMRLLGRTASASLHGAQALHGTIQDRRAQNRAARVQLEEERAAAFAVPDPDITPQNATPVIRHESFSADRYEQWAPEPEEIREEAPKGLFSKMPSLLRIGSSEPAGSAALYDDETQPIDQGDRVRSRITDAIRARTGAGQQMPVTKPGVNPAVSAAIAGRMEPQLTRPAGPQPLVVPPIAAAEEGFTPEYEAEYAGDSGVVPAMEGPMRPITPAPTQTISTGFAPKPVVQHAPRKAIQPSRQARAEAQPALQFDEKHTAYETPPLHLLASPDAVTRHHLSDEALAENARMLENVLDDYGVKGEIVSVRPGPVVTMYELEPAPGLKASRVIGLADDIARSMSALSARVSTVPGRSVIGIELPNENREMVVLREILSSRSFGDGNQRLPLALGKDIGGDPIVANLAKMPHLLIAGTTGSGKSVAINTMILSLLYRLSPEECRLIMIDPKMLELSVYDGIPHLLSPVVTDPKKAVVALKWVVGEMEDRYRKMSKMGVRNIEGYNSRVADALSRGELFSRTVQTGFDDDTGEPVFETEEMVPEKMPYIVVIVDEMADLMMVAGKEIEACIQRLAQMARASGIHLIMATQRPSVDVITGTIKANFPTRISFQVTSKVDSRTILGEQGAEQLLGQGDMLYMAGGSKITRVHGPFCSDEEVEEIVSYLKSFGPPEYKSGVVDGPDEEKADNIDAVLGLGGNTDGEDALYDTAVAIVLKDRKCSTSYIQRKLAIGYNKAARLVEQMEEQGIVSPANHVGKREILVPEQA